MNRKHTPAIRTFRNTLKQLCTYTILTASITACTSRAYKVADDDRFLIQGTQMENVGESGVTNVLELKDFKSINCYSTGNIEFIQSPDYSVRLSGPESFVRNTACYVKNGVLHIHNKRNVKVEGAGAGHLIIKISAPSLRHVKLSGTSRFFSEKLDLSAFDLTVSGVARFRCHDIKCTDLTVIGEEASRMRIGAIDAEDASFTISGASRCGIGINARKLDIKASDATRSHFSAQTKTLTADNSGAASMNLQFKGEKARINGSGASRTEMDIDCSDLLVQNSGTASIDIAGRALKQDIKSTGKAVINTEKLRFE